MQNKLRNVLKILPTDYDCFGGQIKRWENPDENYPDCSGGCKHFVPLNGDLQSDWGVCANSRSPRAGLLTWEHMAGYKCFESAEKNLGETNG